MIAWKMTRITLTNIHVKCTLPLWYLSLKFFLEVLLKDMGSSRMSRVNVPQNGSKLGGEENDFSLKEFEFYNPEMKKKKQHKKKDDYI